MRLIRDREQGGEFYRWHPVTGVMEKVKPKRFSVLPIVTGNY